MGSQKKGTRPQRKPAPVVSNRAMMERTLREIGKLDLSDMSPEEATDYINEQMASGRLSQMTIETPLDKAQELVYQAWETAGRRRLDLARRALETSPDCADAYVLLAEAAHTPEEARDLYQKGIEAGERAIGPEAFAEVEGRFWGVIDTRPYMRARAGLAGVLWVLGETAQAAEHYAEILRLNPSDNQGVRFLQIECLIELGRDEGGRALLESYPDDITANWAYAAALLAFRAQGTGPRARGKLWAAMEKNPWVPAYLFGIWPLPEEMPEYVGVGDEAEAIAYVGSAIRNWTRTPGAIEWLEKQFRRKMVLELGEE